jgi:O-antigen/teichoic acid export membrane protein
MPSVTLPTLIRDYLALATGSVGRLVIALAYFLVAVNVLSLADFGLFATASATGVVLARIAGFGFISPLFRAATVRPRLTGAYLGGFLALFVLSLPLVALIAAALQVTLFRAMAPLAFAMVIAAEVVGWRLLESVAIINNGRRAFARASILVLLGSLIRTIAALGFWLYGATDLMTWSATYLAANLASAALAYGVFLPPLRLRFAPRLYIAQMREAVFAASADLIFYVQAELDKAVVLAAAGPRLAGLYAVAMRIIDLTAMPIRSMNQLVMQKLMTDRRVRLGPLALAGIEAGIAAVSIGALLAVIALLWLEPGLLGRNIGEAAALFPLLIAVPALRNLIEYHAELLYGLGRTGVRALLLLACAGLKAGLMLALIRFMGADGPWLAWLNGVFLMLYGLSAAVTYAMVLRATAPAAGLPRAPVSHRR